MCTPSSLSLYSGIIPEAGQGTSLSTRKQTLLAVCKANSLPPILSLWPPKIVCFKIQFGTEDVAGVGELIPCL